MERLTSAQVRGARGMLDWSMLDLAKTAGISVATVKRFETGEAGVVSKATADLIRQALEAAEVGFLADVGGGPGLRLRPRGTSSVARFFPSH